MGGYGVELVTASRRGPWGGNRDRALHRGRPGVVGGLAEFRPDPSDVLAGDSTSGGADGARSGLGGPGIRNARPAAGGAGRRGRRPLWIGIVCLEHLWIAALAALAFPFRDTVLLLHRFSTYGLTRTVFGSIAAASFLLLTGRSLDALNRAWNSGDLDITDAEARGRASAGGITGRRFAGFLRAWGALRRLRFVIAVLALASAGLLLILWVLLPRLSAVRASGRPSVILVSIDTLRADRLGALGSARPRTPLLDGIATEGMVFEQAMSAAPWTLPSHASLFASRLPFDQRRLWDYNHEVPLRQTLLAEWFREAGYRTAAFTGGGYVSSRCGFGQGFEIYED